MKISFEKAMGLLSLLLVGFLLGFSTAIFAEAERGRVTQLPSGATEVRVRPDIYMDDWRMLQSGSTEQDLQNTVSPEWL